MNMTLGETTVSDKERLRKRADLKRTVASFAVGVAAGLAIVHFEPTPEYTPSLVQPTFYDKDFEDCSRVDTHGWQGMPVESMNQVHQAERHGQTLCNYNGQTYQVVFSRLLA